MKTPSSIFRLLLAWFLLLVVCFQHLAGRLYVCQVYSVEIESRMTPHEQAIATMLKAKTGIDIQVTLLGEDQPRYVCRTGYSAPVIVAKEIDGETYCYAIGQRPTCTYWVNNQQATEGIPCDESILVQLFSDFFFDTSGFLFATPLSKRHASGFLPLNCMPTGDCPVPYPPPRMA
ncbi:MAG: hypothetical protein H6574_16215 [Lewinellaceae bacterium]|nr:hypothetical protein [Saprospiraceae bacterium]MCB9332618.1 hypothetical protein [Lewinellaceae bacterium]